MGIPTNDKWIIGVLLMLSALYVSGAQPEDPECDYCNQHRRCEVGGNRGVCMGSTACWSQNGIYVGDCPFGYGVCCMFEYSCGGVTSMEQFYFTNPRSYNPYCNLQVQINNPRVTQLRLDFKRFSLAQPDGGTVSSPTAYFCNQDRFTVSTSSGGSYGFQALCGENTGQHIYVPVDASMGTATVNLNFMLSNGMNPAQWDIIVTQLDCTSSDSAGLCAPAGCLQYYPSPSGSFESFNFNNGAGHYLGLLNYNICFKRNNGVCGIQYMGDSFTLATDAMSQPYGDSGCDVQDPSDTMASRDYLFIPAGRTTSNMQESKFCGNSLASSNYVTSSTPGQFYVTFKSDDKRDPIITGEEIGFHIRYQESGFGC
ncbi:uncharacterized protein LOC124169662 [Ischnura elegans]|uniref:uncharacterized protein LOC124169662 n=1 Tax=Ischnura elegans TaxID=197161 RepID=UPI001ED87E97|nr:uncharacterized protein LOC124169662 [Ischnura elegans]